MKKEKTHAFNIGVSKFVNTDLNKSDELKKTFIVVKCKDEIDAIIEHNKKFKNYYSVDEYLIFKVGSFAYSVAKRKNLNLSVN